MQGERQHVAVVVERSARPFTQYVETLESCRLWKSVLSKVAEVEADEVKSSVIASAQVREAGPKATQACQAPKGCTSGLVKKTPRVMLRCLTCE